MEEFDNPSYEKTPPFSRKENKEVDWDMVEMEDIDLNDHNPIDIVSIKLEDEEEMLRRQKSHSCSDLENV